MMSFIGPVLFIFIEPEAAIAQRAHYIVNQILYVCKYPY